MKLEPRNRPHMIFDKEYNEARIDSSNCAGKTGHPNT